MPKKQLIYKEDLIAEYDRVHIGPPGGARKLMEEAPTIDAVEVVRCNDCKNWEDGYFGYCTKNHTAMDYAAFCSYGERRPGNGR